MKKRNLLLVLAVGLSGCSYVKVTPEGQGIRLVQALDEVSQCKKLGATTTRVLSKFIFERGKEKVADELAASTSRVTRAPVAVSCRVNSTNGSPASAGW